MAAAEAAAAEHPAGFAASAAARGYSDSDDDEVHTGSCTVRCFAVCCQLAVHAAGPEHCAVSLLQTAASDASSQSRSDWGPGEAGGARSQYDAKPGSIASTYWRAERSDRKKLLSVVDERWAPCRHIRSPPLSYTHAARCVDVMQLPVCQTRPLTAWRLFLLQL